MLSWANAFLILALLAGLFGFTGIAGAAAGIAKILFFVFLVLLVISGIAHALRGKPPVWGAASKNHKINSALRGK